MDGSPPRRPAAPRKLTPAVLRKLTPVPGRRVEERVPTNVPIVLRVGKRRMPLVTGDVSHGGLFVVTAESFDLRQLVHVELDLPPEGRPFTATGWLVHARAIDGAAQGAGVGVQFYGLGREDQDRWDRFVSDCKSTLQARHVHPDPSLARGEAVARAFKRDAAHVATMRVTFSDLAALRTALSRDVARGALFFAIDVGARVVGERVGLELEHPTSHEVFEIEGRIRRVVRDDRVEGLEVKVAIDEERRRRFEEFVDDPSSAEGDPA